MCAHACVYVRARMWTLAQACMSMRRSEDNLHEWFSPSPTPVPRLGSEHLYLWLSHWTQRECRAVCLLMLVGVSSDYSKSIWAVNWALYLTHSRIEQAVVKEGVTDWWSKQMDYAHGATSHLNDISTWFRRSKQTLGQIHFIFYSIILLLIHSK